MGCSGSTHVSRDLVGAPRPDGEEQLAPEARIIKASRQQQQEKQLDVCLNNGATPIQLLKQRSAVEEIMTYHSAGYNGVSQSGDLGEIGVRSFDSTLRCCNVGSLNSQEAYMEKDQTILIFDWDDTLCPSTWCRRHMRFNARGNLIGNCPPEAEKELNLLSQQVIPLLRAAQAMGKVVLVTNARRPWVDTSCKAFLPQVTEVLKDITVIYAMELLQENEKDFASNPQCLTESKARAMKAAVSDFYSRYEGQSWKNLVSIGDALYEHDAIRQVARERPDGGLPVPKKCRTKTVKLIEGPSLMGMTVQLNIIESWLAKIVQADHDVDIDLSADEATVNKWVKQYGIDGHAP